LKDNRLVPLGFTTSHPSYDTTLIAGVPASDMDFNRDMFAVEGSGTDILHFHIPVSGVTGALHATARIYYQPIPPAWNAEMFAFNSARIDTFRTMLSQSDGSPILVAADSIGLGPLGVEERMADRLSILPNPTVDGTLEIRYATTDRVTFVAAYDARGRAVDPRPEQRDGSLRLVLPEAVGVYLIHLRVNGQLVLERVVRR
jgi:hypothetical protein